MSVRNRLVFLLVGFWCSGFAVAMNLSTLVRGMPGGLSRAAVTLLLIVSAVCAFLLGNRLYRDFAEPLEDDGETPDIV